MVGFSSTVVLVSTTLALLFLQQTHGFSNNMARATTSCSHAALFSFKAFDYSEPDAIMQEQNGGVVPHKDSKPIKTVPSALSRISIEKASDDQHDANFHTVKTVPSSMSKIDRGKATDDQHDANFSVVKTVPSSVSKIDRGKATDDQFEANHHDIKTVPSSVSNAHPTRHGLGASSTVTSATTDFAKKSCTQGRGDTDPYYE